MENSRKNFIPTPLGICRRERDGTSFAKLKELMYGHRVAHSQSLFKRDLRGHFGCVNAIEFSTDGEFIASGGDDRRLLLWNVGDTIFGDKSPTVIDTLHISNINSCCFDTSNRKVASGGNDGQVIVHDFAVRQSTTVYGLSEAVYCLSPDPVNATILATASDDGKAQILDTRMPTDTTPFVLADLSSAMHSITYNPVDPRLLATANSKHGIGLWDIRMPLKSINYKSSVQNCMSVKFNSRGDRLLALRRRSSPVLYDVGKMHPIYEFDYKTYYNACTLKSCSFAGLKDEYVMSGSDDFCIYLWKIPTDISESYTQTEPHMILKSHRSIVNQVRYCHHNQFIISSGVEKLVKLWSPYNLPGCTGHLVHSRRYGDDDEVERNAYSHEEYIHMVLQAGSFLSHDYTNGSTEEEPCMIAFFDSLIQREIEQTIEGEDDEEEEKEASSDDDDNNDDPGNGDGGGGKKGVLVRSLSDAPLCLCDSATPNASAIPPVNDGEDTNHTLDTVGSTSSRLEDSSRPFYMDLGSSSDSDSEVDEILSAMYSRYMTSRERAMSSTTRPSGKKISSVIAKGKQRSSVAKGKVCPRKRMRIHEDLQHSEDQFLRDNATNMSILADVIDNFVDNLVASESNNSRTLSDTNDGHMSTDSGSNSNARENHILPEDTSQQIANISENLNSTANTAEPSSIQQTSYVPQSSGCPDSQSSIRAVHDAHESEMYFVPELQAFAPDSINGLLNMDHRSNLTESNSISSNLRDSCLPSSMGPKSRAKGQQTGSLDDNFSITNKPVKLNNAESESAQNCASLCFPANNESSSILANAAKHQSDLISENPFHFVTSDRSNSDSSFRAIVRNGTKLSSKNGNHNSILSNNSSSDKNGLDNKNGVAVTGSDAFMAKLHTSCQRAVTGCSHSSSSISSSSSLSASSSKYFGSSSSLSSSETPPVPMNEYCNTKSEFQSNKMPAESENSSVVSVKFKKAKVKGRRFRVRRSESRSSSDEER